MTPSQYVAGDQKMPPGAATIVRKFIHRSKHCWPQADAQPLHFLDWVIPKGNLKIIFHPSISESKKEHARFELSHPLYHYGDWWVLPWVQLPVVMFILGMPRWRSTRTLPWQKLYLRCQVISDWNNESFKRVAKNTKSACESWLKRSFIAWEVPMWVQKLPVGRWKVN